VRGLLRASRPTGWRPRSPGSDAGAGTGSDEGSGTGSDEGSGTVLVLVAVLVGCFLLVLTLALGAAILSRHQAEAAADLAALAAVGSCDVAQRVAEANGVQLIQCWNLGDGSVLVGVQTRPIHLFLHLVSARGLARAGPGESDVGP
jgi:secretion/DNA translocation related TadE-like protein